MDLSIIIINWNTRQLLLDCIASVYATVREARFEIFVVDNGSTDGSVDAVAKTYPAVRIIANKTNLGFARANNQAICMIEGRYAVLLNSDTLLKENALEDMLRFMEAHPRAGICGPQLLFGDGTRQISFGVFPSLLEEFGGKIIERFFFPQRYMERQGRKRAVFSGPAIVDFVIGACMMVRKEAIEQVGMLDEDYFFNYEEVDWCLRMKNAGWDVWHLPGVEIFHFQNRSFSGLNFRARVESWRSRYIFFQKKLKLSALGAKGLVILGFLLNTFRFVGYGVLNTLSLFSLKRLRTRWLMFGYLLLWHLRGRPESMGLPRQGRIKTA